jgi:ABC-type Fe3+ transport system, periplasmic component
VQYVEGGSGVVVERIAKEKSNPQADVLVTLPPFIQKAAADGLLQPFTPAGADQILASEKDPNGDLLRWSITTPPSSTTRRPWARRLRTSPISWIPSSRTRSSTRPPGQAGDGTAVMLLINQVYGGKQGGFDYLQKLQANNRGPSSSTGKLTALVNKGELWVANGDLQMNIAQMADNPNIQVFWPAGPNGERTALFLPYYIGLVQGAPHADAGKKLIEFLLSRMPR